MLVGEGLCLSRCFLQHHSGPTQHDALIVQHVFSNRPELLQLASAFA